MKGNEAEILLRDMQEYRELTDRVKAIYGDQMTLKDMVDVMERIIRELGRKDPVNARILTYDEAAMWDEYRKSGTPEELKAAFKYLQLVKKHGTVGKTIEECAEYEEIGTPEECRAAMDRQNPKKPITVETDAMTTKYICPACSCLVGWATGPFPDLRYCSICGQKLDME